MPEHRVISTRFGKQPPPVSQTWAAIFLLFFIFQIREHCYNCSNYCGYTSYQSNNTFTSHTQSLPKLNSSNCRQSLGANRQFRHFQNQYSIYLYICIDICKNVSISVFFYKCVWKKTGARKLTGVQALQQMTGRNKKPSSFK